MDENLKLFKKSKRNHHNLASYQDLLELLNTLSEEDLQQTITIYMDGIDEYLPVVFELYNVESTDVLDEDHKVIILKYPEAGE